MILSHMASPCLNGQLTNPFLITYVSVLNYLRIRFVGLRIRFIV